MKNIFIILLVSNCVFSQKNINDSIKIRTIDRYAKIFKDSLQGKHLINFQAPLLTSKIINLNSNRGKVIMLNFWFVGCAPCMGEISDINGIYKSVKDSNFVLLSLARNSISELNKFQKSKYERIEYPIIANCNEIARSYYVSGYPTTIFIDKKGIVRLTFSGVPIQSLKKYVKMYGDKNLSKEWKVILKTYQDTSEKGTEQIFLEVINDLLNE